MRIEQYTSDNKAIWDSFIDTAKNPLFMHKRDFMEYHSDRFEDYSLMFFDEKDKLIALLPANIKDNILYSHQGLTYGGFIIGSDMKQTKMLECFNSLKQFMQEKGIEKLIYKTIPYIFHKYPAEEDLYALFVNNARLIKVEPSTTIFLPNAYKMPKGRKAQISRAKREGVVIEEFTDFKTFIELENDVLEEKHNTKAVHTADELELLHSRFPNNIKLYTASYEGKVIAGCLIFEYENTVHTQYLAADDTAREIGGLDLLVKTLIDKYKDTKTYFDFGISTEDAGKYLNEGLISQKEGFGGRTISYQAWEVCIKDYMMNIKSIDKEEVTSFLLEHLRQESESGYTFEEESEMNNSNKNVILKLEYIPDSTFTEQKFKLLVSYNRYDNKLLEFIKAKVSSFHYPSYITEVTNDIQYNPYNLGKYLFSIKFVLKLPQNKTL